MRRCVLICFSSVLLVEKFAFLILILLLLHNQLYQWNLIAIYWSHFFSSLLFALNAGLFLLRLNIFILLIIYPIKIDTACLEWILEYLLLLPANLIFKSIIGNELISTLNILRLFFLFLPIVSAYTAWSEVFSFHNFLFSNINLSSLRRCNSFFKMMVIICLKSFWLFVLCMIVFNGLKEHCAIW